MLILCTLNSFWLYNFIDLHFFDKEVVMTSKCRATNAFKIFVVLLKSIITRAITRTLNNLLHEPKHLNPWIRVGHKVINNKLGKKNLISNKGEWNNSFIKFFNRLGKWTFQSIYTKCWLQKAGKIFARRLLGKRARRSLISRCYFFIICLFLVSIEKIHQTLKTMFHHISDHLVKTTPLPVIFSTLFLVFRKIFKHVLSCLIYYLPIGNRKVTQAMLSL